MSGRRGQVRVAFVNSGGVLRVSHDVIVVKAARNEFVATSSQPGIPGDVLTIAFVDEDAEKTESVRVTASRPVMVGGILKHELRLERRDAHRINRDTDRRQVESENQ